MSIIPNTFKTPPSSSAISTPNPANNTNDPNSPANKDPNIHISHVPNSGVSEVILYCSFVNQSIFNQFFNNSIRK